MSKTEKSKYQGFREFYEERDEKPRGKPQRSHQGRNRARLNERLKSIDPKNLVDEDFDDLDDYYG